MIEIMVMMIVFGFLARNEHKSINGSVGLMAIVTVGIGLVGYFATAYVLVQYTEIRSPWVMILANICWIGLGYGAYRFIQAKRDQAFYDRLNS